MDKLIQLKDGITTIAGLGIAVFGPAAMYVKDANPELAYTLGFIACICGGVIGYFNGKTVK